MSKARTNQWLRALMLCGAVAAPFSAAFAASALPASYFGSPIDAADVDRVVTIQPNTRSVTVHDGDNIRFVVGTGNAGSNSFTWHFERYANDDTLESSIPLSKLAPAGVTIDHPVEVYVYRNLEFDY